jgi:hypothetical protein
MSTLSVSAWRILEGILQRKAFGKICWIMWELLVWSRQLTTCKKVFGKICWIMWDLLVGSRQLTTCKKQILYRPGQANRNTTIWNSSTTNFSRNYLSTINIILTAIRTIWTVKHLQACANVLITCVGACVSTNKPTLNPRDCRCLMRCFACSNRAVLACCASWLCLFSSSILRRVSSRSWQHS